MLQQFNVIHQLLVVMLAGWINRWQQAQIEFLKGENLTLKECLNEELGRRRLRLTDVQRRRLAELGKPLGRKLLGELAGIVTPDTILRWYRQLVAQKFDGSKNRQSPGRPRVKEDVEKLVVQIAQENPSYGYDRIQGVLANLGHQLDPITIRNILLRNNLEPSPRRKKGMSWPQFMKTQWEVLAASDFFTAEVATWYGIVTYYVFFVIHLSTRRVQIAGITPHPHEEYMCQCVRNLTDDFDGFLKDKRYLIHDRDDKFSKKVDKTLRDAGVEPVVLPPRSPNLNAYAERFVLSVKSECLSQLILFGERSLRHVLQRYLEHYHRERNHQGLDNRLIEAGPEVGQREGEVVRKERLGGLLAYYYRKAA